MKTLDKLISKIALLFSGVLAIILILLPFSSIKFLSTNNITRFINLAKGDYIYSVVALLMLLLFVKALFSGITKGANRKNHIITPMNFGDLKISDEAIEGLTQNVISKIAGIRSSKIIVDFQDGYICIQIKGQVAPEVNIPSITVDIQNGVKETIESHTGIQVSRVNVDILSISSPTKSLK